MNNSKCRYFFLTVSLIWCAEILNQSLQKGLRPFKWKQRILRALSSGQPLLSTKTRKTKPSLLKLVEFNNQWSEVVQRQIRSVLNAWREDSHRQPAGSAPTFTEEEWNANKPQTLRLKPQTAGKNRQLSLFLFLSRCAPPTAPAATSARNNKVLSNIFSLLAKKRNETFSQSMRRFLTRRPHSPPLFPSCPATSCYQTEAEFTEGGVRFVHEVRKHKCINKHAWQREPV